jgi:predicted ATPase/DNA-binding SARP family transcriptional activator
VELLGSMRLRIADQTVTRFPGQKVAALLAFLALKPGPHPREHLLDLFWPELDLPAGRNNLSTTLVSVRRLVEPIGVRRGAVLVTSHAEVGLNPAAITTDVARFEALLKRAARTPEPASRAALLVEAVGLYRGDLLPGHYQDWAVREQERLLARLGEALERLSLNQEALGDVSGALSSVERLCVLDPYSEETHCRLVGLYVRLGRLGLAREAQDRFVRRFAEEFGSSPSAAMVSVASLLAQSPNLPSPEPMGVAASSPRALSQKPKSTRISVSDDTALQLPVLPVVLTRFFGREPELEQLGKLLLPHKLTPLGPEAPLAPVCLVTLVGPGGIGKTRLALEFARQASTRFASWCAFVSLADLTTTAQIEAALVQALRLSPDPGASGLERVIDTLRKQDRPGAPTLLIMDNLEHLLPVEELGEGGGVGALVQRLLESVPGLRMLCTSRRRLGVRGEQLVIVAPLQMPQAPADTAVKLELATLLSSASVRLYVDRAQAVRPDFSLTPTNAPAVAALCRQLEGSPLALELAAAWVRVLPPRKMWERLTQGLDIPTGSYADLPARHRTLSAALDWSYRLLSERQRRLLARLSVFAGGWTAEAASEVCEAGAPEGVGPGQGEAWLVLGQLQEASLVVVTDDDEGEVRYRFLETVRVFSRQRLIELGQQEVMQSRHAAYYSALAAEAETQLRGPEQAAWLARLEAEHDNLRVALEFLLADADGIAGLEMATKLMRFWRVRGYWEEGCRRLAAALERAGDASDILLRAKALNGLGALVHLQGDLDQAKTLYEQALALRRQAGQRGSVADTLHNLGYIALRQQDWEPARALYEEALTIQRELGDALAVADELHHLGLLAHEQDDLARAQALYEESLTLRTPLHDLRGMTITLGTLANIASAQRDFSRAQALHERVLAQQRELGDMQGIGLTLQNLARTVNSLGDVERAQNLYRESLTIRREIGDRAGILDVLEGIAVVAYKLGQYDRSATFLAGAEALQPSISVPGSDVLSQAHRDLREQVRVALGEAAYAIACIAGERMTLEECISYALQEISL